MTTREVPQIRIPRVALTTPSGHLRENDYLSPRSATIGRTNDISNSPSYIVDHLPSRRLTEIDSPFYIHSLFPSRRPIENGYSTAPLRIRTDMNTRYFDTQTDRRHRAPTSADNSAEFIRFSEYPATSAVIGIEPPRVLVPSEEEETENSARQVAETNQDVDRLALFNNSSLGYQRICFLLSRYPALALCMISTWMLWGRGLGLKSVSQNENVAYIVSFVAGVYILSAQIFLSFSHHNSYKAEKFLSNLYHFSNIIGVLIAITAIVFSAISYQNVKQSTLLEACTWLDTNTTTCFSPSERQVFLSIVIGASSLITLLYLFSGVYGCIGQSLMAKKRKDEYKSYAEAHDNSAFRY